MAENLREKQVLEWANEFTNEFPKRAKLIKYSLVGIEYHFGGDRIPEETIKMEYNFLGDDIYRKYFSLSVRTGFGHCAFTDDSKRNQVIHTDSEINALFAFAFKKPDLQLKFGNSKLVQTLREITNVPQREFFNLVKRNLIEETESNPNFLNRLTSFFHFPFAQLSAFEYLAGKIDSAVEEYVVDLG